MKLSSEDVPAFQHGKERNTVIAKRDACVARVQRRIGMRKIKISIFGNAVEEPGRSRAAQLIPAHMRKAIVRRKGRNLLREESEAAVAGGFIACRKHRLQAKTDSKERRAARDGFSQRLDQRAFAQRAHECAEVAHAGKNQSVAVRERLRSGNAARLDAQASESALHRGKIPCSVFHESDVHSSPFVLGRMCFNCGSRVAAKRSARANALKIAST